MTVSLNSQNMTKRVLGPDGAITRLANKYFTQNAASANEPSFQPDFASWQRKSTGHTCAFDLNATKEISSLWQTSAPNSSIFIQMESIFITINLIFPRREFFKLIFENLPNNGLFFNLRNMLI